ncbi:hypothetical protein R8Z50_22520 [Longispora sp. K20-0274]|uniref:hypothetical protein n=1 Tax=Longispora sp. K20-0274 TaxID=3088255 RepID=UPI0039996837
MWDSADLTADHKAVAETYARHVRDVHGDKSASADLAWLTYDRLQVGAGIRRRSNVKKILDDLESGGWLVVVQRVHRRPTVYRLAIPEPATVPAGVTTVVPPMETTVVPPLVAARDHGSHIMAARGGTGSSDVRTPPLEELPSISSPSPAVRVTDVRRVIAVTGADEQQAVAIIAKIRNDHHIVHSLTAYLRAIPDDDLRHHHATLHPHTGANDVAHRSAAFEHQRRTAPNCIHDYPAGALIRPTTGRALCPLCQRGRPPVAPNRGKPGRR